MFIKKKKSHHTLDRTAVEHYHERQLEDAVHSIHPALSQKHIISCNYAQTAHTHTTVVPEPCTGIQGKRRPPPAEKHEC